MAWEVCREAEKGNSIKDQPCQSYRGREEET